MKKSKILLILSGAIPTATLLTSLLFLSSNIQRLPEQEAPNIDQKPPINSTILESCPPDYEKIKTIPLGRATGRGSLYGVAVNEITNKVYVAHSGNGTLAVIDGSSDSLMKTIILEDILTGLEGVAVNPLTNKVYVASGFGSKLWVIDGTTDTAIKYIPVGKYPIGVAVDPSTNRVYVASNGDNTVSVIDGNTDTLITSISISSMPRFVTANAIDHRIYISNFLDSSVSVIDGSSDGDIIGKIPLKVPPSSGAAGIIVIPSTKKIYVASSGITVVNTTSNEILYQIEVGGNAGVFQLAANHLSNEIYATIRSSTPGQLAVIDGENDTVKRIIDLGDTPMGVAFNSSTNKVYVTNTYDNTVSVVAKNNDCPVNNTTRLTG